MIIEPVDDNIYEWRIRVYKFPSLLNKASAESVETIATDMILLESIYDYNYIELLLQFEPNLHPFMPPIVSIVRPRLKDFVFQKVNLLPCLSINNWNPITGLKDSVEGVLQLLSSSRIDVQSPYNDIIKYTRSSYPMLELLLMEVSVFANVPSVLSELENLKQLKIHSVDSAASSSMANPIVSSTAVVGVPYSDISSAVVNANNTATVSTSEIKTVTNTPSVPVTKSAVGKECWKKGTGYGRNGVDAVSIFLCCH